MLTVIQTEASSEVGFGHVVRSVTLARGLQEVRQDVRIQVEDRMAQNYVCAHGVKLAGQRLAEVAEILVRDVRTLYPTTGGLHRWIDVVDVAADASGYAQVVLAMLWEQYDKVYGCGPIIRPEFLEQPRRKVPGRVVVSLGGTDPTGSTERVVMYLRTAGIDAVGIIGPGARPPASDQHVIRTEAIWRDLAEAQVAVVTGGMTLLECASIGVPCVALANNDMEDARLKWLINKGNPWFYYAGYTQRFHPGFLQSTVQGLLGCERVRGTLGKRGMEQVDGGGLAHAVAAITIAQGLRPMAQPVQLGLNV